MEKLLQIRERLLHLAKRLEPLGPTLARLTLGVVFVQTGWGKLKDLDKVTGFFTELHIPMPHFNAVLAASTEFVGGLCVLLGLMTRLAVLPMAFTMVIAILTAKREQLGGIADLLGFEEWTYIVLFLWLAVSGPGPLSLDGLLAKKLVRPPK
jgi:putative oxidoreductase